MGQRKNPKELRGQNDGRGERDLEVSPEKTTRRIFSSSWVTGPI